tara:strand:+ start:509 stop:955 length:447 start_codon:yes stop_codon:yes gene_type:complete
MSNNKVLVISGPNLNLLGTREPEIYGSTTLETIHKNLEKIARENNLNISCRQSNSESEIISWIQESNNNYAAIIINAGAFTHTSVAIKDALLAFSGEIIEVHLSNTFKREPFRHHSFISSISNGIIIGFGEKSYYLALESLVKKNEKN